MKGNTPPPWHGPEHSVPHTHSLNTLQNTLLKPSSHTGLILYNKLFLKKKQKGTQNAIHFLRRKSASFFFFSFSFYLLWNLSRSILRCDEFHFKETWKAGSFKNPDVFSLLLTCYSSQFLLLPIIKGSHSGWTSELLVELLKSYRFQALKPCTFFEPEIAHLGMSIIYAEVQQLSPDVLLVSRQSSANVFWKDPLWP